MLIEAVCAGSFMIIYISKFYVSIGSQELIGTNNVFVNWLELICSFKYWTLLLNYLLLFIFLEVLFIVMLNCGFVIRRVTCYQM